MRFKLWKVFSYTSQRYSNVFSYTTQEPKILKSLFLYHTGAKDTQKILEFIKKLEWYTWIEPQSYSSAAIFLFSFVIIIIIIIDNNCIIIVIIIIIIVIFINLQCNIYRGLIILDEVHMAPADKFRNCVSTTTSRLKVSP